MARVAPSERFRRELDEALEAVDEHVDPIETVGRLGAWLILQQALRTAGSWAGHGMSAAKSPWRVQRHLLQPRIGHPGAELGQYRMIKTRVVQGQPQQVLPVDPGPHRLSRLPAGQLLRPRQDRHQRQPRRRPATTARIPDAAANSLIRSHSPGRSRTCTASGRGRLPGIWPRSADPAPARQQPART